MGTNNEHLGLPTYCITTVKCCKQSRIQHVTVKDGEKGFKWRVSH